MTFETTNTKLAAALVTLGFRLDGADYGDRVTLRIRPDRVLGYDPPEFDMLWRDKQWQLHNQSHPFMHIVRVAEAREWLLDRVVHRYNGEQERPTCATFNTDLLALAACIVADGFFLLYFETKTFYFPTDASVVAERYRAPDEAMHLQLAYLSELRRLLERIHNRKNLSCQRRNGEVASRRQHIMHNDSIEWR